MEREREEVCRRERGRERGTTLDLTTSLKKKKVKIKIRFPFVLFNVKSNFCMFFHDIGEKRKIPFEVFLIN